MKQGTDTTSAPATHQTVTRGRSHRLFMYCVLLLAWFAAGIAAQGSDQLQQAIGLFHDGRETEALSALNEAVRENPDRPLIYYYAAWIRIHKGQYDRALSNLERAAGDSAGFHDAFALRALAYRGRGDTDQALRAWRKFTDAAGTLDETDTGTVDAIIPPDEYHRLLAEQEQRREEERIARQQAEQERRLAEQRERQQREQATADSLAEAARLAEQAAADSIAYARAIADSIASAQQTSPSEPALSTQTGQTAALPAASTDQEDSADDTASSPPAEDTDAEGTGLSIADTPLGEIEHQITADIRSVITWSVGTGIILMLGIGILLYRRYRRRRKDDETVFSEQVERLLDDMKFEVTENQTLSEFDRKRNEIINQLETVTRPEAAPEQSFADFMDEPEEPEPEPEPVSRTEPERPEMTEPSRESESTHTSLITEEVKSLVSRLAREGKSATEIARTADLTVTEVNLILAVRERRIQHMAADIHHEEDTTPRNQLIQAITGLTHEGASPREIARKLDLSLSEVELTLSITALKHQQTD